MSKLIDWQNSGRNYEALAMALWKHVAKGASIGDLAKTLGTHSQRIRGWERNSTPIRASVWCVLARKNKVPLQDSAVVILAPRLPPKFPALFTERSAQTGYLGPLLRQLRGERTLAETRKILGLKTGGAYHHWETGRRDIPLARLLQAIDLLGSRLHSFCETLQYQQSLDAFGLLGNKADFSEKFFALPWTPTVFLCVQTKNYQRQKRHDDRKLASQLKLTREQVVEALTALADLEMIAFDGKLYRPRQGQFYAPPTLTPAKLDQLHRYWFSRSADLYEQPGFHKIEEHALSHESLRRITGWVAELRERIRAEVLKSEPETVVHIHWQLAEMLSKSATPPPKKAPNSSVLSGKGVRK